MGIINRPDLLYVFLFSAGPGIIIFPTMILAIIEDKIFSLQQKVQLHGSTWFAYEVLIVIISTLINILLIVTITLLVLIIGYWVRSHI